LRELEAKDFNSSAAFNFLVKALSASSSLPEGQSRAIKLVVPQSGGYIARSDIIPLRFQCCESVEFVDSFSEPQQYFPGSGSVVPFFQKLPEIFNLSAGGFFLRRRDHYELSIDSQLQSLDKELVNRLSFPWLVSEKRPSNTIAIVEGGYSHLHRENLHLAAKALGIDVVVIDKPGHWMQGPTYESWRKAFIPTQLKPGDALPDIIVDALNRYGKPVDGLVTLWDQGMLGTAKAALRLGLPTNAPSTYEIATDKYKTSQFEGHPSSRVSNLEEALSAIESTDLEYPLIVKPCSGWLSEGVYKVQSDSDLATALNAINTDRHGKDFVIEKYCDGPELDVNFILCDDELLFFEPSDEFPKSADKENNTPTSSFMEFGNVYPSTLPPQELDTLRNSLHASLKRLGLKNGMFHLEARIQDSRMEYGMEDGVLDLVPHKNRRELEPSTWLIEINTRPPGVGEVDMVSILYGIDYWAISLCTAIGDTERAKALSTPFVAGPQCWGEMVMIPIQIGGIFDSSDICQELMQRRPDLARHIEKSLCFWKRGDRLPDPSSGLNMWVAQYLVFSRESRKHVLALGEEIRRETRWTLL
jgi:ATP-grasp N-terminal domain/ATP-grasp domain